MAVVYIIAKINPNPQEKHKQWFDWQTWVHFWSTMAYLGLFEELWLVHVIKTSKFRLIAFFKYDYWWTAKK